MDVSLLGWKPYVKSWIEKQFNNEVDRNKMNDLFGKYVENTLLFKSKETSEPVIYYYINISIFVILFLH